MASPNGADSPNRQGRKAAAMKSAIAPMPASEASNPSVFIDHGLLAKMDDGSFSLLASLLGDELLAILSPERASKAGRK